MIKNSSGIVAVEMIVVIKSDLAANSLCFLYASANNIVDMALGVPAWRTNAVTSISLKFKIRHTIYTNRGKIKSFMYKFYIFIELVKISEEL